MENLFQSLPANLDQEVFDVIIDSKNLKIERIVSKGQASPEGEWQQQSQNEWVMVVAGAAIIAFENEADVNLEKGSYLNILAQKKHRVKWTDPTTETIWLAVHYGE